MLVIRLLSRLQINSCKRLQLIPVVLYHKRLMVDLGLSSKINTPVAIPYSCEAGSCGSCAATCTKGKVWMAFNQVLMDEEIANGRILCCQAYPINGDVEIVI